MADLTAYRNLSGQNANAFVAYDEAHQSISTLNTTPTLEELPLAQAQTRAAAQHFLKTAEKHFGTEVLNFAFPAEERNSLAQKKSPLRNNAIQEIIRRADGVTAELATYNPNQRFRSKWAIRDYANKELAAAKANSNNLPRVPLASRLEPLKQKRLFSSINTNIKKEPVAILELANNNNLHERTSLRLRRAEVDVENARATLTPFLGAKKYKFGLSQ